MHSKHRFDPRGWQPRRVVATGVAVALLGGLVALGTASANPPANKVRNPGFERSTAGWAAAWDGSRLSRVSGGHDGAYAGRLSATRPDANLVLNDVPNILRNTVAGRTYVASAWVRTSSPASVTLRLREWKAGVVVTRASARVHAGKSWKHLRVSMKATHSGSSIALNVIKRHAPMGFTLDVDAVTLKAEGGAATKPATKPRASGGKGKTLFGEAMWMKSGESWPQTFSRLQSTYGRIDMVRAYLQKPPTTWSGYLSVGPRPMNVSFKAPPKEILSGKYDAALKTWFRTAPKNRTVWWTYYHEPEDNIKRGEFTAAQYRDAWRHIVKIADANAPKNLKATLVLMDWSLFPHSGRNWKDYYAGSAYIDVLAWDGYNSHTTKPTQYHPPARDYALAIKTCKAAGKPCAYAEWGSQVIEGDNGTGRAKWMKRVARYFAKHGLAFAAYFDAPVGNDYRLLDKPSQQALKDIMAGRY